jgi:4'-phosphopantetheinyl transferase
MVPTAPQLLWARLPDIEDRTHDLLAGLPEDERARAGRFRIADARNRFVLGRTLLRRTLGGLLGVPGESLALAVDDRGKPRLAERDAQRSLHFNLSHSGRVVALAVAAVPVGVDVEALREVANVERLARRFFSPAEAAAVLAAAGGDRGRIFLRTWTQKEAYLKATGLGIGMALREVETDPDPSHAPRLVAVAGDRAEAGRWSLVEVEIPGAVCTVAVAGDAQEIAVRRVAPEALAG